MSNAYDQDEEELDDRELPDESDMDQDDDDEASTEACPHCHRPVYTEAHICPYCGSAMRRSRRTPVWIAIVVIVCLILMIFFGIL